MKRILISLGIILAVTIMVSQGTIAYFSDVEESHDNIFTAGSLDLKVDGTAHYNGLICLNNVWTDQNATSTPPIIDEQRANGGCTTDAAFMEASNNLECQPRTPCPTWVDLECQDYGFDRGVAKWDWKQGQYEADGPENGTMVTGTDGQATWYANPAVDGVVFKTRRSRTVLPGGTTGTVSAAHHGIVHITLCDNEESAVCGNGIVEEGEQCDGKAGTPEGYVCSQECTLVEDRACTGTWELTDLENGVHTFFSLANLKLGDYGENTISLHVFDNNAWGRIRIGNLTDSDNGCVEPEVGSDPDCVNPGDIGAGGELHDHMEFSAWLDQGRIPGFQNTNKHPGDPEYDELEGDNVLQKEYEPLFKDKELLSLSGETWNLWEILGTAYTTYCNSGEYAVDGNDAESACHGIAKDGRIVGGATYYIGYAWELPTSAGNSVQSDILTGDVTLEVEQHRTIMAPFTL